MVDLTLKLNCNVDSTLNSTWLFGMVEYLCEILFCYEYCNRVDRISAAISEGIGTVCNTDEQV